MYSHVTWSFRDSIERNTFRRFSFHPVFSLLLFLTDAAAEALLATSKGKSDGFGCEHVQTTPTLGADARFAEWAEWEMWRTYSNLLSSFFFVDLTNRIATGETWIESLFLEDQMNTN